MKQKDILVIVVVVAVSAVFSFVIAGFIFGSPQDHNVQVEKVDPISTDFTKPDEKYFNAKSIDPSKTISIDENNNPNPFNKTQQ